MGTKLALALGRREEPHLIEIEYFSTRDHDKTCSAPISKGQKHKYYLAEEKLLQDQRRPVIPIVEGRSILIKYGKLVTSNHVNCYAASEPFLSSVLVVSKQDHKKA